MAYQYDIKDVAVPLMGKPVKRYEARAKVTGEVRYAADEPLSGTLHAALATVQIASGTIRSVDTRAAMAVDGVRFVLTHDNAGVKPEMHSMTVGGPMQSSFYPLSGTDVRYAGQIVALVVAETLEDAQLGASLVDTQVEAAEGKPLASMHAANAGEPETLSEKLYKPALSGDLDGTFAAADATVDVEYRTPVQHHNPLELWFTSAEWHNGGLTAYIPSQWVVGARSALAGIFSLPTEKVRVVSKFVGGAFGSKGSVLNHTIMVAEAARKLGRPVKLYLEREQTFTAGSYRPSSTSHIRMAAKGGRLTAIDHRHIGQTSRFDTYADTGTEQTARMYGYAATRTAEQVVRCDTNTPGFMRAPAEVPSVFALECAIDELCVQSGIDPVQMRIDSDSDKEPVSGKPWTSRSLVQCLRKGAETFGWSERPQKARAQQRGDWLYGQGMASSIYPTYVAAGSAELRLASDLSVRISAATQDLGTGTYTIAQQLVAAELGLPLQNIRVEMGDSDLPANGVSGGSSSAASVSSAVLDACRRVRSRLIELAVADDGALAGSDSSSITFADSKLSDGKRSVEMSKVFDKVPFGIIEERGTWAPAAAKISSTRELYRKGRAAFGGFELDDVIQAAFGAQFVEVAVHRLTGEVRVKRMAGAFAAGRILNQRTARSQLMGGMIWGIGSALHEKTEIDDRYARFVNTDLAEYLVTVNADIPKVSIDLIEEEDTIVNPLGVKGIGEIGIVGTNAAIANAVYHATGKRLRELPIRMEHLI